MTTTGRSVEFSRQAGTASRKGILAVLYFKLFVKVLSPYKKSAHIRKELETIS